MDFSALDRQRRRGPPVRALTEVVPEYAPHDTLSFQSHPRPMPPRLRSDTLRMPCVESDEHPDSEPKNISEESSEEGGVEEEGESRRNSLLFTINRQLSQTHSEPDTADSSVRQGMVERSVTWAEPRIKVIPPSSHPRTMLMAMHSEYTSITDELETVCGLLSPPMSPSLLTPPRHGDGNIAGRRSRHHSEMSNPEMARFLEKEHLRDAEESDYQLMEGLIQRRLKASDDDKFQNNAFFLATTPEMERYQGKLRRCSAIEGDISTPRISASTTPNIQSPVEASATTDTVKETMLKEEEEPQVVAKTVSPSVQSNFPTKKLFKNAQKEVQL